MFGGALVDTIETGAIVVGAFVVSTIMIWAVVTGVVVVVSAGLHCFVCAHRELLYKQLSEFRSNPVLTKLNQTKTFNI